MKGVLLACAFQVKPIILKCPSQLNGMTEVRMKWMNSHSVKEKQGAIVTFLKTGMACQEGPTSPFSCMASSPTHSNTEQRLL